MGRELMATAITTLLAQAPSTTPSPSGHVVLDGLWHRYDGTGGGAWTLQNVNLSLAQGELVGMLGPSGCGKTTLLRLIAGFERPAKGSICINGREVAGPNRWLEPERRGVGMVFQDYALFPHLNAWDNACFGLRRGTDSSRARWLLELLGLGGLEQRYPHELSGGQRQRLAVARALAPGPAVVLMDEPFSNLDVEVRMRLRSELPGVLQQCGTSGLLVTHDPEEALAICDRVAVLRDGELHQCASPRQLVEQPATAFVGQFVQQANLVPVLAIDGSMLNTALGHWQLSTGSLNPAAEPVLLVHPEALLLQSDPDGEALVLGREFLGRDWLYLVQLGDLRLRLRLPLSHDWTRGQRARLVQQPGASALLYPGRLPVQPA